MNPQPPYPAPPQQRPHPLLAAIYGIVATILGLGWGIPLPKLPYAPPPQYPPTAPVAPPSSPTAPVPSAPNVTPPAPAPVIPTTPPAQKPDTLAAIGRIQFGRAGCSATIIGPKRADGSVWVLTAAHCVDSIGQEGSMLLRDGRKLTLTVLAVDRLADCCWCRGVGDSDSYPFAQVALRTPATGAKIWHAGFGIDRPGNREDGTVTAGPNRDGQIELRISVSSGDSGGAFVLNSTGEVISCVCCGTVGVVPPRVWGASPEAINRLKHLAEGPSSSPGCPKCPPVELPTA